MQIMSNLRDGGNYGLRPRKASRARYAETTGIDQTDEIRSEITDSKKENTRKVYLLPIVVSGENETVAENTLEIEISDSDILPALEVSADEIPEKSGNTDVKLEVIANGSEKPHNSNTLKRIEEILRQNDQLIESIKENPKLKKQRRLKGASSDMEVDENKSSDDSQEDSGFTIMHITMEKLKAAAIRPLTSDEDAEIQDLFKCGKNSEVFEMLFGPSAVNRTRKCYECSSLIEGPDSVYEAHYLEAHKSGAIFMCEFCENLTSSSQQYQNHVKEHFDFKSRSATSKGDKTGSSCEESGEPASNEPCVCDICGKTLKHQKSLYSHRRTHTDSKAVCHICGATLKSSRYLHHHLLLHKNVEKPHKCDKCGKAFFSSSALKVHHYYNHEETPGRFQCTICGKSFKAKQGLQFHMDSHSSELRYECSYCHKRFRGFKTCRVHELRHKESNEPGKFRCQVCGKCFKTRQTLKNHEDVHASFNRYQCSLCEKRFKLRKSCLAHIRVHHNDERSRTEEVATLTNEGEVAVESLLAGEEYVVTLEEGEDVETVLRLEDVSAQGHETIELIVPEAHVECEVSNFS